LISDSIFFMVLRFYILYVFENLQVHILLILKKKKIIKNAINKSLMTMQLILFYSIRHVKTILSDILLDNKHTIDNN
jgi:hypothetical protein